MELLMINNDSVYLISINLYELHTKNSDAFIKQKGKLITLEDSGTIFLIAHVFHCNGLLLCVPRDINSRLVVCNPYYGKSKWIKRPTNIYYHRFAFGYDKSSGDHKILRFYNYDHDFSIYNLSSDSWRDLEATLDRNILVYTKHGLSLKGNTYWYAGAGAQGSVDGFLLCFDFTRERFGPCLPLPFDSTAGCNVSLSSVREEQLALLMLPWHQYDQIEIWVTNKIDPDAVSWSNFFKVGSPLLQIDNFFVDDDKKIALVFAQYHMAFEACMGGENRYLTFFERTDHLTNSTGICSYVPTSLQIK